MPHTMSIATSSGITTITCDKCGKSSAYQEAIANRMFYDEGWGLKASTVNTTHICRDCQTPNQRKAHDFVRAKFPLKP